jgi:hypothetical protein
MSDRVCPASPRVHFWRIQPPKKCTRVHFLAVKYPAYTWRRRHRRVRLKAWTHVRIRSLRLKTASVSLGDLRGCARQGRVILVLWDVRYMHILSGTISQHRAQDHKGMIFNGDLSKFRTPSLWRLTQSKEWASWIQASAEKRFQKATASRKDCTFRSR